MLRKSVTLTRLYAEERRYPNPTVNVLRKDVTATRPATATLFCPSEETVDVAITIVAVSSTTSPSLYCGYLRRLSTSPLLYFGYLRRPSTSPSPYCGRLRRLSMLPPLYHCHLRRLSTSPPFYRCRLRRLSTSPLMYCGHVVRLLTSPLPYCGRLTSPPLYCGRVRKLSTSSPLYCAVLGDCRRHRHSTVQYYETVDVITTVLWPSCLLVISSRVWSCD